MMPSGMTQLYQAERVKTTAEQRRADAEHVHAERGHQPLPVESGPHPRHHGGRGLGPGSAVAGFAHPLIVAEPQPARLRPAPAGRTKPPSRRAARNPSARAIRRPRRVTPAAGQRFAITGEVVRAGRTLVVCRGNRPGISGLPRDWGQCQCWRSASISWALVIVDRPLMPIWRARLTRSSLDQSW